MDGFYNLLKNKHQRFVSEAVKKDGWTLQFIKEQTTEICLEAVRNNGYVLNFVKNRHRFVSKLKPVKRMDCIFTICQRTDTRDLS